MEIDMELEHSLMWLNRQMDEGDHPQSAHKVIEYMLFIERENQRMGIELEQANDRQHRMEVELSMLKMRLADAEVSYNKLAELQANTYNSFSIYRASMKDYKSKAKWWMVMFYTALGCWLIFILSKILSSQ